MEDDRMPLKLLRRLAAVRLPAEFSDPDEIEKLALLRGRGQIVVLLPDATMEAARVLMITAEGWRTLRSPPTSYWPPLR